MDKETRTRIQRATQTARALLEREYAEQLGGVFDIRADGMIAPQAGSHLDAGQRLLRSKIVAAVEHHRQGRLKPDAAVATYTREAAFTTLNRFVALKMLEARGLVQECISRGDQSAGFKEFVGLAPGLVQVSDHGYRLYIESIFDEIGRGVRVLFDRHDPANLLWPGRLALLDLQAILNAVELAEVWKEDETIGWVYQYFNGDDERAQMRDVKRGGSQAPRNSRELAVRNQFFTPRYVVEFLVDNTLGRMWIEMHRGSRLAERCRYFVKTEEEQTRTRERKDPRDLRILDPACGSGHFLLYSSDLLLTIYEEAWAAGPSAPCSQATGRRLNDDYADLASLRQAMPALILEHNLHGVDIDPRAAQIAAFALWLRAQRAWKDIGIPAADRPAVRRTHVVVAEPMPADAALVEEFAAGLEPPLLRGLFKKMVGEMRLAGELGTLIPIEEHIAADLRNAREQFAAQQLERETGFLPGIEPVRKQGELDLSGIDDDSFFVEAETRFMIALRQFAEAAAGVSSVGRRLFAGDAAQGIALIDLLRTRFDVVLMNPPFGDASLVAKKEFEKAFPRTKSDIYAAFVERGIHLLHPHGLLGAITSRTGFFLSRFQQWREEILLGEARPAVYADLGFGVMDDAMVEAAAYCLERTRTGDGTKTVFIRVPGAEDKSSALLEVVREPGRANGVRRFEVVPSVFTGVPRSPFAYWVSERLLGLFSRLPAMENGDRAIKVGVQTFDDPRFLLLFWERDAENGQSGWRPFAKGGVHSPFYSDVHLLVRFADSGREIAAFKYAHRPREGLQHRATEYFGHPGFTWPRRTLGGLSLRAMPAGCVFADKGPAAFVNGDCPEELLALLAVTNGCVFKTLIEMQMAVGSYEVGVIQRTPVPPFVRESRSELATLGRRAWSLNRLLDTITETSHAFTRPALLQVPGTDVASRSVSWSQHVRSIESELARIQSEIDERCFEMYGISEDDRRAIVHGFNVGTTRAVAADEANDGEPEDEDEDDSESDSLANTASIAAESVSWTVGVAFGRFDVRLATGERPVPPEPEPFDPLPACSPGMLIGSDALPLGRPPAGYPLAFPEAGVLVDDPGHPLDLTAAVRAVFDAAFHSDSDAWSNDVAALLDPKDHEFRRWCAASFFEYHIKRYSKSRRKAPIYWQLATPSASYSVWLYYHRFTRDTLYSVLNEIVAPKLKHEERKLASLVQDGGPTSLASQRKEIDAQERFVAELRAFHDDVARVAPLWNPDLNDGVIINFAPLWRLVPQHRSWQKECKDCWDKLVSGEYDWAHLAMHLWPERVVPKCVVDRSLAIAHGLQDVFWLQDGDGKWRKREVDGASVARLVAERTSSAVKNALRSLLEVPASSAGRGRSRRAASPRRAPAEEALR